MSWKKVRTVLVIILLIIASELFRYYSGLPITLMDLIILPITLLLMYLAGHIIVEYFKPPKNTGVAATQPTVWQLVFGFMVSALLAPAGLWLCYQGWLSPFALHTSVKGAAHGYTLVHLGLVLSLCSFAFSVVAIVKLFKKCIGAAMHKRT